MQPVAPLTDPLRKAADELADAIAEMQQYCDETRVTHICEDYYPNSKAACGQCQINAALDAYRAERRKEAK